MDVRPEYDRSEENPMRRRRERELFSEMAIPTRRRILLIALAASVRNRMRFAARPRPIERRRAALRAYKWRSMVAASAGGVWKTVHAGTEGPHELAM